MSTSTSGVGSHRRRSGIGCPCGACSNSLETLANFIKTLPPTSSTHAVRLDYSAAVISKRGGRMTTVNATRCPDFMKREALVFADGMVCIFSTIVDAASEVMPWIA